MRFMTTTAAITVLALLSACNEARMTREVTSGGQNPIPYSEQPGRSNAQKIETWSMVGASQQGSSVLEAERRLAQLANLMKTRGTAATFNSLNGKDSTNNSGQRLQDEDFKVLISDPDGRISGVRCIEGSRFVVNGTGAGIGGDANQWRDITGKPVLMSMIQALRGMPTARVNYTLAMASPVGGAPISKDMTAVVASSEFLLGQKNTGKPFLCWIDVEGN